MRLSVRGFSRYRPRALTLVVFVVSAALITLANLSFDQVSEWFAGFGVRSYGWPLVWHRYVLLVNGLPLTVGWYYSANRLAINLVLWILLLALPAVACEWLLRRYRPRPNWSLRTLLVGVGAAAAMCGLFAALRDRAALQDALIAKLQGGVWVQRSGPKWLDLVGADPFRRQIVGAYLPRTCVVRGDGSGKELLTEFARFPKLRYLWIECGAQVRDMPDGWLLAIGKLSQLEHLRLSDMKVSGERLASLAGLKKLQWLDLTGLVKVEEAREAPLLTHLPLLPRLEYLDLNGSQVGDRDLYHLARFPCLKSLNVRGSSISAGGLPELARLPFLEELEIDSEMLSAAGLASLSKAKSLRRLHICPQIRASNALAALALDHEQIIYVPDRELNGLSRALKELRKQKPELVIDIPSDRLRTRRSKMEDYCVDYDALAEHHPTWWPESGAPPPSPWMAPYEAEALLRFKSWAETKGLPTSF